MLIPVAYWQANCPERPGQWTVLAGRCEAGSAWGAGKPPWALIWCLAGGRGWVSGNFGIDSSVARFSVNDYIIRSLDIGIKMLVILGLLALLLVLGHRWLSGMLASRQQPSMTRRVILICTLTVPGSLVEESVQHDGGRAAAEVRTRTWPRPIPPPRRPAATPGVGPSARSARSPAGTPGYCPTGRPRPPPGRSAARRLVEHRLANQPGQA
jgi:hypothetical protein